MYRVGGSRTSWLQASTTNEEPINIRLTSQALAVLCSDRPSVENTGGLSGIALETSTSEPFSDLGVSALGLLWGGSSEGLGSNSPIISRLNLAFHHGRRGIVYDVPDWLISNNDVSPVLDTSINNGLQLPGVDLLGLSVPALIGALTNAKNNAQSTIQGNLGLLSNLRIGLTSLTTLAVSKDSPVNTVLLKLLDSNFTSVSTWLLVVNILGSDLNLFVSSIVKNLFCLEEIERGGGNDDLFCEQLGISYGENP